IIHSRLYWLTCNVPAFLAIEVIREQRLKSPAPSGGLLVSYKAILYYTTKVSIDKFDSDIMLVPSVKKWGGGQIMEPLIEAEEIFDSLVQEMNKLINEDVIITNEGGVIVASTIASRIGDYHEGAELEMKSRTSIVMTKELTETLQGG